MPGVPLMYVNSGSYPPPTMVSNGTFGHQVGHNGTSPAPPGTYMTPALVPNLVFRQNVPVSCIIVREKILYYYYYHYFLFQVVAGVRASTPGNSQKTSRSPTPAHELFGSGSGDRSAQPQPRYPLPMYQGVHIVQGIIYIRFKGAFSSIYGFLDFSYNLFTGDMRLMHPAVPANPRLQYAPVPSPPVVQGCPRPYRPPSYSSNTSGAGTPTSFDGRNQKIRKQRWFQFRSAKTFIRYRLQNIEKCDCNIEMEKRDGNVNLCLYYRSKVTPLPLTGARPNLYQTPSMPSLSSNVPKDIREGKNRYYRY